MKGLYPIKRLAASALLCALAACSAEKQGDEKAAPPVEVNVMTLRASDIALTETLPGRVEASRTAEVRARVTGIVEKRLFTEGSMVEKNDVLFLIDPAPYQARYEAALAQQAKAQAVLEEADYQAQRYQRLYKDKAISEHELIRANAQKMQAKAQLRAAQAEVKTSKIDLDYTEVKAPIAGHIGRELVTEGALVSQSAATLMANVQQTDQVYVNFQESSQALLQRYRQTESGKLALPKDDSVSVILLLPDGSEYPHQGHLLFSDINVEQSTGQVLMRAVIDNPEGLLMPGLFVQVKLTQASLPNAFSVPQRAVVRSAMGDSVMIIDDENRMRRRDVSIAGSIEGRWVITEGVKQGERIMVDGFQKAKVDQEVQPVVLENSQKNQ